MLPLEYDVLSAIIEKKFIHWWIKQVLLRKESQPQQWIEEKTAEDLPTRLKHIEKATLDDFILKNAEPATFEPLFTLRKPYVLLSEAELEAIVSQGGGWKNLHKKYPGAGGLNSVSRVGFNAQQTQALAYVGLQFQEKSGIGFYHVLEKSGDKWKIKESSGAWKA